MKRVTHDAIVVRDPRTREILRIARRIAPGEANVLLRGESGSGKDVLARYIHRHGPRAGGPLVKIDCANIPPDLLESELFGHEKGAFTDASESKIGRFELARGGTVLIDEVTELSLALQAKLLRVIQEKRFERLGSNRTIEMDARIVATTNGDIEAMVDTRRFRSDLYYRLNVISIEVLPLRMRPGDIVPLAERFLKRARRQHGRDVTGFTAAAKELLTAHSWPGNAWELRNVVEQAAVLGAGSLVDVTDLRLRATAALDDQVSTAAERRYSLEELERAYILEVLSRTRGHLGKTAKWLGIHRKTLLEKRRRYGIEP
ncbi:MAG: sigma-54 dependent transcriptional regulator [Acidobacteriota bacterium]